MVLKAGDDGGLNNENVSEEKRDQSESHLAERIDPNGRYGFMNLGKGNISGK